MSQEKLPIPVVETIKKRHSVRTFEPRALSEADRAQLASYIDQVSNPFGPDVRIRMIDRATSEQGEKLGTYGVIKGAGTYLAVTLKKQPLGMLAAGYQFENLLLCATDEGLGSVMLALTFNRDAFSHELKLEEDELFPVVSPVGYPAAKRSLRERAMRTSLRASSRKPWGDLFFEDNYTTELSPEAAGEYAEPLEMARLAPSSANGQPWRVVKQGNAFHFFETHKDDLSEGEAAIKELDLGIAVAHFHQTALELGLVGRFEQADVLPENVPAEWHYHVSWVAE